MTFIHNCKQLLIAIDQVFNVLIGLICFKKAWADETMSANAYRLEQERGRKWPRFLIDAIFFWQPNHCKTSYESEVMRKQLPKHYQ